MTLRVVRRSIGRPLGRAVAVAPAFGEARQRGDHEQRDRRRSGSARRRACRRRAGRRSDPPRGRRPRPAALHRYINSTACRCPCPSSMSRWCRCSLSAWPMPWPRRVRRTIASTTSMAGISSMRNGTANAPAVAAISPPLGSVRFLPIPSIVAMASSIPRNIEPASPMKIFAGWKFQGRNPMQMPAVMADSRAACDAGPSSPGLQHDVGEEEDGRDRHHARREPVQTVEQVDRVRDRHGPRDRHDHRQIPGQDEHAEVREPEVPHLRDRTGRGPRR